MEGYDVEWDVHSPHDGDAAEEVVVPIDYLAAFAWTECADLAARRAPVESARRQPDVEEHDPGASDAERSK
jgi:hypothetical protein